MSNDNGPKIIPAIDFQGLACRADIDKIPDNKFIFGRNITLSKTGTIAKRFGSTVLGTISSGSRIQGAIEFLQSSGTRNIIAVANGDIHSYNGATWSKIATSQFSSSSTINTAVFINGAVAPFDKMYFISQSDYLTSLNSAGTIAVVGTGGNEIKGQNICMAQNTLFVSNVTYIGGTGVVNYQDRCYYSFTTGPTPTDQLYTNASGQNTMATSLRYFTLHAPIVASFTFGVTGLSYHFTEDKCYQFDLRTASALIGPQLVFNIGICGPRAICECNGWMIFMDKNGRQWCWGGSGLPVPLTHDIEDDFYGDSFISSLDKSTLSTVSAGAIYNTFYFSVGNLTYQGEALTNVQLKGIMGQNIWRIPETNYSHDDYPVQANIFIHAKLSGIDQILFGSQTTAAMYQMNTPTYNDDGTAITMELMTKFYSNNDFFLSKEITDMYVKYRPSVTVNNYLVVQYAINNNLSWTDISDPTNNITGNGVINMYDSNSSTLKEAIKVIKMPTIGTFETLGYKLSNNVLNGSCEISGFGSKITPKPLNILVQSS